MVERLRVEGIPQLQRVLKAIGKEAHDELGQLHKEIGRKWIGWLGGPDSGVGAGAGSRYRASATKRDVLLRVGGSHRSKRVEQWGKRRKPERGRRPLVIGAAEGRHDEITDMYLDGIERIIRRHGMT